MRKPKISALELLPDSTAECIKESPAKNDAERFKRQPKCPNSLVADVLETISTGSPGRVLVRWREVDGVLRESWLPVVKGLALSCGDLVLIQCPENWHEWVVTHAIAGAIEPGLDGDTPKTGCLDSKRIEIEGEDEIVLRCGRASITLRRNGRVVIRGTYVESRSEGTNRIKGGNVLIN